MKRFVAGLAALAVALSAGVADARNFRIAGGIQYVIQAMKQKDKGDLEEHARIMRKAVTQLSMGIADDPKDDEAWVYLGQAYAELGVADSAGAAFAEAIQRLADDPKEIKRAEQNREHYWVVAFNEGLQKYREANDILPADQIPNSTDPRAAEAKAKLAEAETGFQNAIAVWPANPKAYDNLAVVLALQGKFDRSSQVIEQGLAQADKEHEEYAKLKERKDSLMSNAVVGMIQKGDYDGALAMLDEVLSRNPNDFDALSRAAQTSFEKGQKLDEAKDAAAAKAAYGKSAEYFARAAEQAPGEQLKKDMRYNRAVAAQNADDHVVAAKTLFALIQDDPKNANLHKMLRGAYDRMGNKEKAGEQVWVILGLSDDAPAVADVAAHTAKVAKASAAGKVLAEHGQPDEIRQFSNEATKIDVWYYWGKKRAFAVSGNQVAGSANFGEFGPEPGATTQPATAAGTKKKG